MKAAKLLYPGFKYKIGNGEISLWYDKWLDEGRICDLIPFVNIQDTLLKVRDIWSDGRRQLDSVATVIPKEIQLHNSSYYDPMTTDVLIWGPASDGSYTAKNFYYWLLSRSDSDIAGLES